MGHYEQTFARQSRHGHNLKELIFMDGDCIFLKNGSCSVYNNRPTACKIFPYTMDKGDECFDTGCPHHKEFEKDEAFIDSARDGFSRIIEDIQSTMSKFQERQREKAI
jgi:Fe-S-cluster containining protein